ncbi:unnamed protein product [Diatraea saccharalis]|uniref:Uncharacterized protein n=1 Tax=Diatraea saccharalis TaxID=40085 RepID=A0A9N9R093_9NEOP|nr:unnamed protein product [Diatraea saccharalis]
MGYNYSLAEYIDSKETNVSVFLKRGVFDDELGDDQGFRRAGHLPVSGLIKDSDLVTSDPEDLAMAERSGRRLDDSVLHSNDKSNFEGSLMKLTAKAPAATEPPPTYKDDEEIVEYVKKFSTDSLDQLKAIQSLMNMRKSGDRRITINYDKTTTLDPRRNNLLMGRRMMIEPESPENNHVYIEKAAIPYERFNFKENPIRTAVPGSFIGESANWLLPNNIEKSYRGTLYSNEMYNDFHATTPGYPKPIRYKTGVERPTLPNQGVSKQTPSLQSDNIPRGEMDARRLDNSELNRVKDKLLMDKAMFPSFKNIDNENLDKQDLDRSEEADYEEEAKRGIRVRKKRNIHSNEVIIKETIYTLPIGTSGNYIKVEHDRKTGKGSVDRENQIISDDIKYTDSMTEEMRKNILNLTDNLDHGNSIFKMKLKNTTMEMINNTMNHSEFTPITVTKKPIKSILSLLKSH